MNLMKTAPRLKLQLPPFRTPRPKRRPPFRSGLFCNLLNPKVVLFVLTFFPQFMDAALPAGPQLALMGVTWAFLGLAWLAVLVVMMDRIRPVFGRPAFQRWLNRTMSVILILFGLRLAAARS